MSEQAPEWTPPADPSDEIPGDPGAPEDTGRPAALENVPSYLESAEGALAMCRKLGAGAAGGNVAAATVMQAFATVGHAFAALHLAEQVQKIDVKLGTKLGQNINTKTEH